MYTSIVCFHSICISQQYQNTVRTFNHNRRINNNKINCKHLPKLNAEQNTNIVPNEKRCYLSISCTPSLPTALSSLFSLISHLACRLLVVRGDPIHRHLMLCLTHTYIHNQNSSTAVSVWEQNRKKEFPSFFFLFILLAYFLGIFFYFIWFVFVEHLFDCCVQSNLFFSCDIC